MSTSEDKRTERWGRRLVYAVLVIVCSLAVTLLMYWLGCEMIPAVAVSFFSFALVLSRWPVFAMVVPLVTFFAFTFGGMQLQDVPTALLTTENRWQIRGQLVRQDDERVIIREAETGVHYRIPRAEISELRTIWLTPRSLLLFSSIALLATAFRFASVATGKAPRILTARLDYTPVRTSYAGEASLPLAELISLGFIPIALGVSSWLCSPLNQQPQLGPHVGLIPEAYFAVKIVLIMAVLVAASRGAFAYLSVAQGGSLASMQLRRELWKAYGSEERRIARRTKNDVPSPSHRLIE